ncbi:hypothetical protein MOMA_00330 [Moraxella macacae 0408225]|uniref:Uncharacterized protein n=1 Tax=Moraxella macacae 0408225 TaxID=1230338 RepID=L2F6Z6_9GAMM|nr:hypothetical protein MOMA_00330 [Moraxella macacae 0408225]
MCDFNFDMQYKTDEKLMNCKINQLQNWLNFLAKLGYIYDKLVFMLNQCLLFKFSFCFLDTHFI